MLCNDLPLNIKRSPSLDIFKSRTKTHLFQLAYFTWLFKCMCECLVMLLFHVMYFGIGRYSFCSYATRIFTSALVSKGQISVCNICPILKPALYKYHIIIFIINIDLLPTWPPLLVCINFNPSMVKQIYVLCGAVWNYIPKLPREWIENFILRFIMSVIIIHTGIKVNPLFVKRGLWCHVPWRTKIDRNGSSVNTRITKFRFISISRYTSVVKHNIKHVRGERLLPELIVTKFCDAIWQNQATICQMILEVPG